MEPKSDLGAIYNGHVVHARVRPCAHSLKYRVFAVLLDCDRLDQLKSRVRLFSHNRFNLFSIHDRDHGDGSPIADYLQSLLADMPERSDIHRFTMLCYPRILGYVFNPLTVYFGLDAHDRPRLMVYEVNNTFGQRKTYVLPVEAKDGSLISQNCRKEFYVSPFNTDTGRYSFRVTPPGENLTVGVALRDKEGPVLKAFFRGERQDLTTANLLGALARTGWMTVKVTAGIHLEAARLWLKGLRLQPRPPAPRRPVTYVGAKSRD